MFAAKRQGWRWRSAYAVATLLCAASVTEAAPATNVAESRPAASTKEKKTPPKTTDTVAKKPAATKAPAATQPPASAPDKKAAERPGGAQMNWPAPPVVRQFTPDASIDATIPPPALPRASRARMRSCAEEWSKKKVQNKTGLPRWRDFATACLTRKVKS